MTSFWKRYTKLQIGSKVITSDDLDIYFKVAVSTDNEGDTAEITVFNLSNTTKETLEPDLPVNLQAGYEDDYGSVFLGKIKIENYLADIVDKSNEIRRIRICEPDLLCHQPRRFRGADRMPPEFFPGKYRYRGPAGGKFKN